MTSLEVCMQVLIVSNIMPDQTVLVNHIHMQNLISDTLLGVKPEEGLKVNANSSML